MPAPGSLTVNLIISSPPYDHRRQTVQVPGLCDRNPFQRDVANLRTVVGYGHPHNVINLTRAVLVEGGSGGFWSWS